MCKSPIHPFLNRLPKCELHLHLEGTLSPTLLFALSLKNSVPLPLPSINPAYLSPTNLQLRYDNFTDLQDFLDYYYLGMSTLLTQEDFEELAWEYFLQCQLDGVRHAEIFFDPQAHTSRGVALETVVAGITTARNRAWTELKISSKLICCFLRHLHPSDAVSTLHAARGHIEDGNIHGVGLDSAELPFPPELFKEAFNLAKELGGDKLLLTSHAGEEGPHTYITNALDHLGVTRIDHGIAAATSREVMGRLKEEGTLLTVCPISNVKLRCVRTIGELPLNTFVEEGVRFNLNSDDPAYFGGHCLENYCQVQQAFGWGEKEWRWVIESGILGSHVDQARKDELLQEMEKVFVEFAAVLVAQKEAVKVVAP